MTEIAWTNQKKINGRLCQVDWRVISALQEVVAVLRATGASGANLENLERLINEADEISASVAIPDPPGCLPGDRKSAGGAI
jgi:hypothetical protein